MSTYRHRERVLDQQTGLFTDSLLTMKRIALPRSDDSRLDPETGFYERDSKSGPYIDDAVSDVSDDVVSHISDDSLDDLLRDMSVEKAIDSNVRSSSSVGTVVTRDTSKGKTAEMETKTAKPEKSRRLWITEGLEELASFIIADEKRVLSNLRIKEFDAAISEGLYIDVPAEKHADEITTAVHDVFNEKVVGKSGGRSSREEWVCVDVVPSGREGRRRRCYVRSCTRS